MRLGVDSDAAASCTLTIKRRLHALTRRPCMSVKLCASTRIAGATVPCERGCTFADWVKAHVAATTATAIAQVARQNGKSYTCVGQATASSLQSIRAHSHVTCCCARRWCGDQHPDAEQHGGQPLYLHGQSGVVVLGTETLPVFLPTLCTASAPTASNPLCALHLFYVMPSCARLCCSRACASHRAK